MADAKMEMTEKGDSKKAQKKEAKKAEKAAKKAEHRGQNQQNNEGTAEEGKLTYFNIAWSINVTFRRRFCRKIWKLPPHQIQH